MKMVLLACAEGMFCRAVGWVNGCVVGLCLLFEDDMGVDRGEFEKCLDVVDVASRWVLVAEALVGRERAFARVLIAGLDDMMRLIHKTLFVQEV
jgi:hypothetical protein